MKIKQRKGYKCSNSHVNIQADSDFDPGPFIRCLIKIIGRKKSCFNAFFRKPDQNDLADVVESKSADPAAVGQVNDEVNHASRYI